MVADDGEDDTWWPVIVVRWYHGYWQGPSSAECSEEEAYGGDWAINLRRLLECTGPESPLLKASFFPRTPQSFPNQEAERYYIEQDYDRYNQRRVRTAQHPWRPAFVERLW